MTVVFLREWDNPNEEDRLQKYRVLTKEMRDNREYWDKKFEGVIKSHTGWSDITRHMISWMEFEDAEAFSKWWADEEVQRVHIDFCHLVDNFTYRLLRPGIGIEPK
jgi:hypothetical protein